MARIFNLVSWFLLGSASFTLLSWIGLLDPHTRLISGVIFLVFAILNLIAWICDDAISQYLRIDDLQYKGALLAIGLFALIGMACALLMERHSWITPG